MRAILAAAALFSFTVLAQTKHSWIITAGKSFGPIREGTTRAELTRIFGKQSIVDGEIPLAEAACVAGTVVYPDSKNEIEIAWQNSQRTKIAFVRTEGPGQWTTARGVRIGMTLQELIRRNGGPLTFSGFGWDYGGQMSWKEGDGALGIALQEAGQTPEQALGDRTVRSDLPGLKLNEIKVARLTASWGEPWDVHDCHY